MRSVLDNDGVARAWARQKSSHGRSHNGNYRFDGAIIYSYRIAIGWIVQTSKGRCYLISSHRYSVSTSRHQSYARYYASDLQFTVPGNDHVANLAYLTEQYHSQVKRLRNMLRSPYWGVTEHLSEYADKATRYARLFDLPKPALDQTGDGAAIEAYRQAREERANSPAGIKRRAYGKWYRNHWLPLSYKRRTFAIRDNIDDVVRHDHTITGWLAWWMYVDGSEYELNIIQQKFGLQPRSD